MIREVAVGDAPRIAEIYNHYVANTVVTFEEAVVSSTEVAQRVREVAASGLPWLVEEDGGRVRGYAYGHAWHTRSAYRFSAETSVYLDPACTGRGLGSALYEVLFERLRGQGRHAVIGGIALPNEASVALHEKFGMRKVAHFREVGWKFGRWVDVGYWQGFL